MGDLFQATLLVCILTCAMMAEAFWSCWYNGKDLSQSLSRSVMTGGGFVIYAAIDYLLITPGAHYLMA